MTDTQDLFERNLEFFNEINPPLAKRLKAHQPVSEIVFDEDGEPDILIHGARLYGEGADKHASKQRGVFWKNPGVSEFSNMNESPLDKEGETFRSNLIKFAEENDITFGPHRTTRASFHFFVLGVGLARHLPALLEDVSPRNLILVEPNFEFLYHSLNHFDWQNELGSLLNDGVSVHILTENRPDPLLLEVRRIYSIYGRANFDGITVYRHYENPLFIAIERFISEEGAALFSGLGFFEDELNMIANTYNNLKCGEEKVFYASPGALDIPAFVIGSGPSLDTTIEVIRENQDKAVIISCGTALLPLLRAGVKPDFHIEIKRAKYQMEIPQAISKEFDISDIWLVGSSTLIPGVKSVFDKRIFFFRHMLSSFPMFSGDVHNCLRFPSPTVGNAGTSFAQDVGFQEIYFFGMDLGFNDPYSHHSENTFYQQKDGLYKVDYQSTQGVLPGNFGGTVMTRSILSWSLDMLESAIANSSMGYKYYNCSDGAFIKGTIPLLPEFVDLPKPSKPKKKQVEHLVERFPVYSKKDFDDHWQDGKLSQDVWELGKNVIEIFRANPDLQTKKYLSAMTEFLPHIAYEHAAVQILRGSAYMSFMVGEYLLDRIEQKDKIEQFSAFLCDECCRLIESMCRECEDEITTLEKTGKLLNRETVWG